MSTLSLAVIILIGIEKNGNHCDLLSRRVRNYWSITLLCRLMFRLSCIYTLHERRRVHLARASIPLFERPTPACKPSKEALSFTSTDSAQMVLLTQITTLAGMRITASGLSLLHFSRSPLLQKLQRLRMQLSEGLEQWKCRSSSIGKRVDFGLAVAREIHIRGEVGRGVSCEGQNTGN